MMPVQRTPTKNSIVVITEPESIATVALPSKHDRGNSEKDIEKGGLSPLSPISADSDDESGPEDESIYAGSNYSNLQLATLVLTVAGAAFLNTLGGQAVVIVLPDIGKELNIPESRQQWIVSAYALTFGCFLLMWGRLADVYGKRLIFIWGSAWMTVTTIIMPFIANEIAFDVLRGLQGLGAAANVPTAIGIIGVTFPPGPAKNYAFSVYAAGAPLGAMFGNILAGIIAQYLQWKWVMWIHAIMCGVVTVVGHFVIPVAADSDVPSTSAPEGTAVTTTLRSKTAKVDWLGGALITIGVMILLFALTEGNVVGWSTPWIPVLIVLSVLIIAAFIYWQWYLENRTARRPLIKVSVFRNIRFSAALVIMAVFLAGFGNFIILTTYFYQEYQGLSVLQTSLRFIPLGICGLTAALSMGYLVNKVKGHYLIMFGTLCSCVACLIFAVPIPPETSWWAWGFPALAISVLGPDTVYPCLTMFTAKTLSREDQALGGALITSVGQVGRAIGLAIATAVQTAVIASKRGVSVEIIGKYGSGAVAEGVVISTVGDDTYLQGIRAGEWASLTMLLISFLIAAVVFRGAGVIGDKKK